MYDDFGLAGVDSTTKPKRFDAGDPEALEYLQKHGYVVIKALNDTEVREAKRLLWEKLQEYGMEPGRPETWDPSTFPANPKNGIISRDFGHSDFMWFLRGIPNVVKAFAGIWGEEDLITSFDGCNIFRPWDKRPAWRTMGGWWHIDQGPGKRGFCCAQGLVSLYDTDASTGGLTVIPGTHLCHDYLVARHGSVGDYVPLSDTDDPLLDRPGLLVSMQAGDLAIWDSRTVHCNFPGKGPATDDKELLRAVGYVCMTPKKDASVEVLQQRKDAFVECRTSTHWPAGCRWTSPGVTAGRRRLEDLTPIQRGLVA